SGGNTGSPEPLRRTRHWLEQRRHEQRPAAAIQGLLMDRLQSVDDRGASLCVPESPPAVLAEELVSRLLATGTPGRRGDERPAEPAAGVGLLTDVADAARVLLRPRLADASSVLALAQEHLRDASQLPDLPEAEPHIEV